MSIATELLALQTASPDGMLHCEKAVDWAQKNKTSALYSALEWDNRKAGQQYRLWQMRRLVEIHVISAGNAPTLVSLSVDRAKGGGYRAVSDVANAPDLRQIMLADALAELQRMQIKYSRVEALASVWREVEKVRQAAPKLKKAA
jgi:hypothetical protein